jgi:HEAT repeat protein
MRRTIILALCLITTGAFATSSELRKVALEQLRAIAEPLFQHGESTAPHFDAFYTDMVESLPPQERAERALELAINRFTGAADYVTTNAASWSGTIKPSERLTALIRTAVESPLIEVRMAGFEANLAEYSIQKTNKSVDDLLKALNEDPKKFGPWSLWNLALIGARGVDRERIFHNLVFFSHATDASMRQHAVDALAKLGGAEAVAPLLDIAAHDQSMAVRERAFCGLAESGTLLLAERYMAVPGLLAIAQDPNADKQTHAWTYQALREITGVHNVPDDADAWRPQLEKLRLL